MNRRFSSADEKMLNYEDIQLCVCRDRDRPSFRLVSHNKSTTLRKPMI